MLYNFGKELLKAEVLSNSSPLKILAIGGEAFPELKFLRSCYHPTVSQMDIALAITLLDHIPGLQNTKISCIIAVPNTNI